MSATILFFFFLVVVLMFELRAMFLLDRCSSIAATGAVCDQKILVFVLQMEESKQQSTWMG
jgi:hypothetical protein